MAPTRGSVFLEPMQPQVLFFFISSTIPTNQPPIPGTISMTGTSARRVIRIFSYGDSGQTGLERLQGPEKGAFDRQLPLRPFAEIFWSPAQLFWAIF